MCHPVVGTTVGQMIAVKENYQKTGRPVTHHNQVTGICDIEVIYYSNAPILSAVPSYFAYCSAKSIGYWWDGVVIFTTTRLCKQELYPTVRNPLENLTDFFMEKLRMLQYTAHWASRLLQSGQEYSKVLRSFITHLGSIGSAVLMGQCQGWYLRRVEYLEEI